jgi:hypothetical protein
MDRRSLIRCAVPDREWEFKATLMKMDECYESVRLHCIAIHGLRADDMESYMFFDSEKFMLHLLKA